MPRLCEVYPGICLTPEEKASVRVAGECQLAKSIQNRAYLSISIHKHNNKNITYRIKYKYTEHTTVYKTIKKKETEEHHYTANSCGAGQSSTRSLVWVQNLVSGTKLTLRRLMSYIYIYIYIYMEHPFLMFLDHTQRRSTVGRTPLDE